MGNVVSIGEAKKARRVEQQPARAERPEGGPGARSAVSAVGLEMLAPFSAKQHLHEHCRALIEANGEWQPFDAPKSLLFYTLIQHHPRFAEKLVEGRLAGDVSVITRPNLKGDLEVALVDTDGSSEAFALQKCIDGYFAAHPDRPKRAPKEPVDPTSIAAERATEFGRRGIRAVDSLCPGESVDAWFVVVSRFERATRDGRPFVIARVVGASGERKLFVWDAKSKDVKPNAAYVAEVRADSRGFSCQLWNVRRQ